MVSWTLFSCWPQSKLQLGVPYNMSQRWTRLLSRLDHSFSWASWAVLCSPVPWSHCMPKRYLAARISRSGLAHYQLLVHWICRSCSFSKLLGYMSGGSSMSLLIFSHPFPPTSPEVQGRPVSLFKRLLQLPWRKRTFKPVFLENQAPYTPQGWQFMPLYIHGWKACALKLRTDLSWTNPYISSLLLLLLFLKAFALNCCAVFWPWINLEHGQSSQNVPLPCLRRCSSLSPVPCWKKL